MAADTPSPSKVKSPGKLTKNEAARLLGRIGGRRGGHARAEALTRDERVRIAKMGAAARAEKYGKLKPKNQS
jgi:hypothetical protein